MLPPGRMLTTPVMPASAGILISHSCTVANFRYKTSSAFGVSRMHPQATACQSALGQAYVLHKPDRLPGFALEKFGHSTPMTLTQLHLQLCLWEETCVNLQNLTISESRGLSAVIQAGPTSSKVDFCPDIGHQGHACPGGNGCWQDTAHLVLR